MPRTAFALLFASSVAVFAAAVGCSHGDELSALPSSPADAGADASDADAGHADGGDAGIADAAGSPCVADVDCDDGVACTVDTCDLSVGRCQSSPDDGRCQNGVFCDGKELCSAKLGCVAGQPVACDDQDPCTIDACVESTTSCKHTPRDADGDGDVDVHCGGGDCDDGDPAVSSKHAELCGNGRDDDCDGQSDEPECSQPAHDGCLDPLVLPGEGTYAMSTAGAKLDLGASCGPLSQATSRDVVAAFTVPPGPPRRVDAKVTVPVGTAAVAISLVCGAPSQELACSRSASSSKGGQVAHARAWSVPPGIYPIVVYADQDTDAVLDFRLADAGEPPANETCGTAKTIQPGVTELVPLVGTAADVATKCGPSTSDLVYRVVLDAPYDVRAYASTVDGAGSAVVSLRKDPCAGIETEVACFQGNPTSAFARKLGPGPVYVAVKASAPTDVSLLVTLEPPTDPPADETCASAPPLATNVDVPIDLKDHADDVKTCVSGLVDAAYALTLDQPSDVLAILRVSQADYGALSIQKPPCESKDGVVGCKVSQPSPMRVAAHGLPKGQYRVVAELADGSPAKLTTLVRPALPPQLVLFADTCDDALLIPKEGGTFQGNTDNANAQYSAGCDQGGTGPFGAREQMLRLELTEKKRVVLDTAGSSFSTLLDVRKGPTCPGAEIPLACTAGYGPQRAFLDVVLEPGSYFVQVDGFAEQSGQWVLDVFLVDPG